MEISTDRVFLEHSTRIFIIFLSRKFYYYWKNPRFIKSSRCNIKNEFSEIQIMKTKINKLT